MTLIEWIESGNFQFKRNNERPWGSYELAVSADTGVSWAGFPRPFGSRWDEKLAFETLLTEAVASDIFKPQLVSWLGEERVNEILHILGINNNVPEHIHNESEG
jgi:hypothetical protein